MTENKFEEFVGKDKSFVGGTIGGWAFTQRMVYKMMMMSVTNVEVQLSPVISSLRENKK